MTRHLTVNKSVAIYRKKLPIWNIIIVLERLISESIAARGLKFWLQVALGPPWGRRPDPVHPDPGNPVFPEIFFSLFLLLWTSWDLRVTPRMDRNHLIRIRTGKSGFSKIRIFRFFAFLSLKTLQHGCLWTRLDPPKSLVSVPRYITVLNGTFLVLNGT